MMKKINVFIMIVFCLYFQKVQANNLSSLLNPDNNVESKIETVDSFSAFNFDPNGDDIHKQLQELQRNINERVIILNEHSVDALAITLKRGRYGVADTLIDLFTREGLNMIDYKTGDKLRSIYPEGANLSEVIDCRIKLHEDYLEDELIGGQHQRILLESAIESLREMKAKIYLVNIPFPSIDRCDEILHTPNIIDDFLEWIGIGGGE